MNSGGRQASHARPAWTPACAGGGVVRRRSRRQIRRCRTRRLSTSPGAPADLPLAIELVYEGYLLHYRQEPRACAGLPGRDAPPGRRLLLRSRSAPGGASRRHRCGRRSSRGSWRSAPFLRVQQAAVRSTTTTCGSSRRSRWAPATARAGPPLPAPTTASTGSSPPAARRPLAGCGRGRPGRPSAPARRASRRHERWPCATSSSCCAARASWSRSRAQVDPLSGDGRDRRPGRQGTRAGAAVHVGQGSPRAGADEPVRHGDGAWSWPWARRWTTWRRASAACSTCRCRRAWPARSRPWGSCASSPRSPPRWSRPARSARSSSSRRTWAGCPCSPPGPATAARSSLCRSSSPRTAQGRRNAGMYRLQVFDAQTTGMHWHVHHDGAANFRESDGRLEVAVALGTDPAVTYAATAPLPPGIDELMFAGFLRGEPVELARCATRRPGGAGRRRDRPRGLRGARRGARRGPLRRSHRLLLAGRPLPGLPRHGHEPPARRRLPGHASSAVRRWRTATSARPPSGSSCRCSASRCPRSSTWSCRWRASSTTAPSSASARRTRVRRARS